MSRVPMGSDGGAWAMDPETNYDTSFVPQGVGADLIATIEGFTRDDVDAYAVALAGARGDGLDGGPLRALASSRCWTATAHVVLDHDEHIRARDDGRDARGRSSRRSR